MILSLLVSVTISGVSSFLLSDAPICDIVVKDNLESQLSPSSSLSSFVTSSSFFPSASSLSSSFDQASNMMMMMSAPSSQSSPLISPSFSTIADGKGGEKSTSSFNPSNPKSAPFSFSPPSASSSSPPSFSASSSAKGISLKNSPSSSSSSSSSSRVISALPGKIATIECRVSANPSQEISFYWTFNGTKIQSFPSSSSSSFLLSSPSMSSPPPAVAAASSSKSRSSVNSASFSLPLSAASSQLHLTSSSPSSRSSSSPSSSSPYNILNSSSTFSIPSPPITAPFNNPSLKQIKLPYHKDSTVQNIQQQSTFRDRDGGEGNVAETEKGLREEIERGLKEANFVEVTNGGLTSLLYFKPMNQATDFGLIACWASNSIGSQMSPCLFTLIPEGKITSSSSCSGNMSLHLLFILFTSCFFSRLLMLLFVSNPNILVPFLVQLLTNFHSSPFHPSFAHSFISIFHFFFDSFLLSSVNPSSIPSLHTYLNSSRLEPIRFLPLYPSSCYILLPTPLHPFRKLGV